MTKHITEEQAARLCERLAETAAANDGHILSEVREFGDDPRFDADGKYFPNKEDYYKGAEGVAFAIESYLDVPLTTLAQIILEIANG